MRGKSCSAQHPRPKIPVTFRQGGNGGDAGQNAFFPGKGLVFLGLQGPLGPSQVHSTFTGAATQTTFHGGIVKHTRRSCHLEDDVELLVLVRPSQDYTGPSCSCWDDDDDDDDALWGSSLVNYSVVERMVAAAAATGDDRLL